MPVGPALQSACRDHQRCQSGWIDVRDAAEVYVQPPYVTGEGFMQHVAHFTGSVQDEWTGHFYGCATGRVAGGSNIDE